MGADSSTDMTCCPFCGSENIGKETRQNGDGDSLFLVVGVISIFRSANKCFDCGKIWKFKKIKQ
ncbi:MAG: hypothetical protein ACLUDU_04035 [Butyricimonas faecihominis]